VQSKLKTSGLREFQEVIKDDKPGP